MLKDNFGASKMREPKSLRVAIIGQYPNNDQLNKQVFTGIMRVIYGLVIGLKTFNIEIEVPSKGLKRSKKFYLNIQNAMRFLHRLLRSNSNIFHFHGIGPPMFLAFIIAKLRKKITIYTAHGLISREKTLGYKYSPLYLFCELLLIKFSDRITTVSTLMKKMIRI